MVDAVEAIRPLLPAWSGFADVLTLVPTAFIVAALTAWLGIRIALGPLRKLPTASWGERARVAHPAAIVAGIFAFVPTILFGTFSLHATGPLSRTPETLVALLVGIAAYLGSFSVRRRFLREIRGRSRTFGADLAGELTGFVLIAPQLLVMVAMILVLEPELDALGAGVLAVGTVAFGLASWHGGLPLARALGAARPAPARVARVVAEASDRSGVPARSVWVARWPMANAIAYPMTGALVFTDEICEALDDAELGAIAHHELAHLSEPLGVRLARVLGALILLPIGAAAPITHHVGAAGAFAMLVAFWCVLLVLQRMARRMEVRADAVGHEHTGNPRLYAGALEKLHAWNLTPAVTGMRNPTHPDLYDRMLATGTEPSYPRPAPPARWRSFAGTVVAATFLAFGAATVPLLPQAGAAWLPGEEGALFATAVSGGRRGLLDLAVLRSRRHRPEDAIALVRAAAALHPEGHHELAYLATLLAWQGRCAEAAEEIALAEAQTRTEAQSERCTWLGQARDSLAACRGETTVADTAP